MSTQILKMSSQNSLYSDILSLQILSLQIQNRISASDIKMYAMYVEESSLLAEPVAMIFHNQLMIDDSMRVPVLLM